MRVKIDGLEALERERIALEAEGDHWDRRIKRLRFHNIWQTIITVAWIAMAVVTWAVFK